MPRERDERELRASFLIERYQKLMTKGLKRNINTIDSMNIMKRKRAEHERTKSQARRTPAMGNC